MEDNSSIFYAFFTLLNSNFVAISFEDELLYLAINDDDFEKKLKFFKKELNVDKTVENIIKFETLITQLNEYIAKKRRVFTIPYRLFGTDFQKGIWKILEKIPYGKTISYKEEAILYGNPKAFRAVANANGKNNLSIIIPCHRVIANSGKLGGYSGGIEIKKALLEIES